MRLVQFLKKIRNRLLHGIEFMAILDTLTLKLLEYETEFWDTTTQILGNFLAQTSLKFMLSLINGNCVYLIDYSAISLNLVLYKIYQTFS